MPQTKTITLYTFEELTDRAKAHARDWYRAQPYDDDYRFVIEDAERILGLLGVTLRYHDVRLMGGGTRKDPNIWWSLGYVQGDGACFEGMYTYAKGAHRKIREEAPQDQKLHRIADQLLEIQRRYQYKLYAKVYQSGSGFWPHVEIDTDGTRPTTPEDDMAMLEVMRNLCTWIYQQLRQEDESRQEDTYVDEQLRESDWTFTEDGGREDP